MNAERILIAGECIGDGRFFVDRAATTPGDRVVFGRPIGANQGVQFPIARAHMMVEAADLMRWKAIDLLRARRALRRRGQHGEVPRLRGLVGRPPTRASTRTAASASPPSTTSSASSARRGSIRSRRSTTIWSWPSSASTSWACRDPTEIPHLHPLRMPPLTAAAALRSAGSCSRNGM